MPEKKPTLRQQREALGYTQEAIARELGIPVKTWWRWESGKTKPKPVTLDGLQAFFAEKASAAKKKRG